MRLRRSGLWGHSDFLRFWAAAAVSQVGSQITLVALPLVAVLVLDASAFEVALLTVFDFLPFLLLGVPAGVWVDRLPRRPVLIAADLGRAVLLASIPVAYWLDALTLPQLYVIGFAVGALTVFFELAHTSYLPTLLERGRLVEGNSKLEVTRSGSFIAGPALAGVLVDLLRAPGAVLVDAASFLVSGFLLLRIRAGESWQERRSERAGMLRETVEGLRFVVGQRYLWPIVVSTAATNLFWNAGFAVYFVFVARELSLEPAAIGLVLMLGNLGWLAGAVTAGGIVARLGIGSTLILSTLLQAPSWALVALAPEESPVPLLVAAHAMTSLAGVVYNVTTVSLRQAVTPAHLQGRTVGALRTVVWGVTPLGALLGGGVAALVGLRETFWVAAAGCALAVLPILLSSARGLRGLPAPAT